MIRNYFKTARRTLTSNRTYTVTNLIGLTLGLAVVMLIASRVLDELSYDRQWTQKDELYRIRTSSHKPPFENRLIDGAPIGISAALATDFPEIAGQTRIELPNTPSKLMLDSLVGHYTELSILETDTGFFNLFDIQSIEGNPKQILPHVKNLIITESTHQHIFNGQEVLGKTFYNIPESAEPEPYRIHAIIRDLPGNSHLQADALLISEQTPVFEPGKAGGYRGQYMLLKADTDTASLTAKINAWYIRKAGPEASAGKKFVLQSVQDIHLRTVTGWGSPMWDVYVLSGIGLLILILICINFINLTFAHAVKRTMESGVRKVLGAKRRHFFYQLGTESLLLFGTSLILAYILYIAVFPAFEAYLGQPLTLGFHRSAGLFAELLVCWLVLGLLCSIFPALALSKTKASQGLKRQLSMLSLPMKTGFTRGLVAVQFSIAMVVVICMLGIGAQIRYMDTKDLGYEPENLLTLDYSEWEGKSIAFKQTLLQQPGIEAASLTMWTPFRGSVDIYPIPDQEDPDNPDKAKILFAVSTDADFVKTFGLRILEGRALNPDYAQDILNREATNVLMTQTGIKSFHLSLDPPSKVETYSPVGIIQDFHAGNLRFPVQNIVLAIVPDEWLTDSNFGACLLVRAEKGKEKEALSAITTIYKQFFPGRILPRINWLEDQLRDQYLKERKQFQQLVFFGTVSMLIALLGVLGLAIYTIERKFKEIGIRKVLGASVRSIVTLLSVSFVKPVLLAAVMAFPVAWWFMHRWLENFAYRIDMPVQLFILTGVFALICMLSVVGWQAARAALANPVDSLRDE